MDQHPEKNRENIKPSPSEPNVLPATEIARNPNPRANENIKEKITRTDGQNEPSTGVGSEITDGEDA